MHVCKIKKKQYDIDLHSHCTRDAIPLPTPPVNEGVLNPAYEENTMPTTLQLKSELIAISDKWFQIGLRLKVPSSTLNAIRRVNPHDNESCLMKMCQEWVVREEEPSWLDIVQALESRVVSEKRLADVIRMRYCDEPPLDSDSSMRQGRQRQTSDCKSSIGGWEGGIGMVRMSI